MQIEYKRTMHNGKMPAKAKNVDLLRIGTCLAIQDGKTLHQLKLTTSQWMLLAEVARNVADGN